MILGIGSDLTRIERIEAIIQRYNLHFLNRVFTQAEQAAAEEKSHTASKSHFYAKRFAAKEAAMKALGTGLRQGVRWVDFEVLQGPQGRPELVLHNKALQIFQEMVPAGMHGMMHLTIADEPPFAHSMVVLSAFMARKN